MTRDPDPRSRTLLLLGTALLCAASCAPQQAGIPGQARQQPPQIPVADASGAQRLLQARVCYPAAAGGAPARLMVVNHGSPPSASAHPAMRLGGCDGEADALHRAFMAAGGKAELEQPGPYDGDGHRLFFGPGGSAVWGPMIERCPARQGASPA